LINTGLTAAMPRVVPDRILAGTNSVLVTVGSVVTAVGAVAAFAILAVAGAGDAAVSWTLLPAVVTALLGAWAVLALPPRHLGPDDDEVSISGGSPLARDALGLFAGGLAEGVRAARSTHLVWVSLTAVSLGRAAFGITTMLAILLLREAESIDGGVPVVAGMGGFGLLSAAVAGGMGVAALVAPWAMARTDRILVVAAGSALSAAAQLAVGPTLDPTALVVGALALGLGAQIVKLVADNAMQTDVPDVRRGGVFALQDALFNTAFVVGMVVVLPLVPADGRSVSLMLVPVALYRASALLAVLLRGRSGTDPDRARGDGAATDRAPAHGADAHRTATHRPATTRATTAGARAHRAGTHAPRHGRSASRRTRRRGPGFDRARVDGTRADRPAERLGGDRAQRQGRIEVTVAVRIGHRHQAAAGVHGERAVVAEHRGSGFGLRAALHGFRWRVLRRRGLGRRGCRLDRRRCLPPGRLRRGGRAVVERADRVRQQRSPVR